MIEWFAVAQRSAWVLKMAVTYEAEPDPIFYTLECQLHLAEGQVFRVRTQTGIAALALIVHNEGRPDNERFVIALQRGPLPEGTVLQ